MLIVLFKILQLCVKHGSLNLIQAAVATDVVKDIFLAWAVIRQCPDAFCNFLVICCYSSSISQCAKILSRIKTVGRRISKASCSFSIEPASMSLSIVLKQVKVIFFADFFYFIGISAASIQMNNHQSFSLWRNFWFNQFIINFKCFKLRLNKNRHQAVLANCKNCGNICIRRNQNLIAFMQTAKLNISAQNPNKSI